MAFFDDMASAVRTYPETEVTIEIIDVVTEGDALNVNEQASYKIKVTNDGPLNLAGVTLRVKGLNGTTLKRPLVVDRPGIPAATSKSARIDADPVQFVGEFVTTPLPQINGHGGSASTAAFTLKAPASTSNGAAKNLVKATLEAWDANLDHILIGHSDPLDTVKGIYSAEVVAA